MRNISLNAHYIVLLTSPRDKPFSCKTGQPWRGSRIYEKLRRSDKSTSWLPNARLTTDDQQRLKTNVLPGEVQQGDTDVMTKYAQKQSYLQPPVLNATYNAEKRMRDIL